MALLVGLGVPGCLLCHGASPRDVLSAGGRCLQDSTRARSEGAARPITWWGPRRGWPRPRRPRPRHPRPNRPGRLPDVAANSAGRPASTGPSAEAAVADPAGASYLPDSPLHRRPRNSVSAPASTSGTAATTAIHGQMVTLRAGHGVHVRRATGRRARALRSRATRVEQHRHRCGTDRRTGDDEQKAGHVAPDPTHRDGSNGCRQPDQSSGRHDGGDRPAGRVQSPRADQGVAHHDGQPAPPRGQQGQPGAHDAEQQHGQPLAGHAHQRFTGDSLRRAEPGRRGDAAAPPRLVLGLLVLGRRLASRRRCPPPACT